MKNSNLVLSYMLTNDTPAYGGKGKQINTTQVSSIQSGDSSNSLLINMSNHIGTHIDFPKHFCEEGKTLNDYLDDFWVFDNIGLVTSSFDELETHFDLLDHDIDFLIVKTGFEKYRGSEDYIFNQPTVESSLAKKLKDRFKNLKVIGFDMISISSYKDRKKGREAHKSFLCENDILLLEDMKLENLYTTPDMIFVAPLLIDKADGVQCFVYAKYNG